MNGISPNDPVVEMLRTMVSSYEKRVSDLEEALEAVMVGTQQALQLMNARLGAIEQNLTFPTRADGSGKEL